MIALLLVILCAVGVALDVDVRRRGEHPAGHLEDELTAWRNADRVLR